MVIPLEFVLIFTGALTVKFVVIILSQPFILVNVSV
jgi:hypothetical protein